ncbi:hypothetical protein [Flavobacterium sp.]|uniref:hypothetical protein n=1 Tax=Flavobacterium sp. TaxID=239 RepID=UPI0035AD98FF
MKKTILLGVLMLTSVTFANNEKNTTSISKSDKKEIAKSVSKPIFFWEVKTINGTASGYTDSEKLAKKTIKLMSRGSIIHSKIIEKYNVNNN